MTNRRWRLMRDDVHRGITRGEVVATIVAVVILLVLVSGCLLPFLKRARCGAASLQDKAQLKQVHSAMLVYANDHEDTLPIPSQIVADATAPIAGKPVPEDFSLNHSAPLYSYLVGANYVPADILASSIGCDLETNPGVEIKNDYDFDIIDPANGIHWDPTFTMRIDDPEIGANASYAHLAFVGDRRELWRASSDDTVPLLSTRGTRGGVTSGPEYLNSPTLRLHGAKKEWVGNIVFADNHTEVANSFNPALVSYERETDGGVITKDNIFAAEFAHPMGNHAANDIFLCICIGSDEFSVKDVYDPLDD